MSTNDSFPIIGLTGGIASGKSTVSQMFRELGVAVIDADQIAREIVEPGEPAYDEIVETFGEAVVGEDGRLDREELGDVVFNDDAARSKLDAITHPRIGQRMMEKAGRAHEQGADWVLYDAALIVENNLQDAFDALIVVAADPEIQRRRLVERDGITRGEAQARLDAQMPLSEKIDVADYVIDNNGTLEETRRQVESLHEIIDRGIDDYDTADRDVLRSQGLIDDDFATL